MSITPALSQRVMFSLFFVVIGSFLSFILVGKDFFLELLLDFPSTRIISGVAIYLGSLLSCNIFFTLMKKFINHNFKRHLLMGLITGLMALPMAFFMQFVITGAMFMSWESFFVSFVMPWLFTLMAYFAWWITTIVTLTGLASGALLFWIKK